MHVKRNIALSLDLGVPVSGIFDVYMIRPEYPEAFPVTPVAGANSFDSKGSFINDVMPIGGLQWGKFTNFLQ